MAHGSTRSADHSPQEQNQRRAGELQPRGFLLQAASHAQLEVLLAAGLGTPREIPTGGCRAGAGAGGLGAGVSATWAYGCGMEMML